MPNMADVNTSRKRKNSDNDVSIIRESEEDSSKEHVDGEDLQVSSEPAPKCPRKSSSPAPNLQICTESVEESKVDSDDVIRCAEGFIGPEPKPESGDSNEEELLNKLLVESADRDELTRNKKEHSGDESFEITGDTDAFIGPPLRPESTSNGNNVSNNRALENNSHDDSNCSERVPEPNPVTKINNVELTDKLEPVIRVSFLSNEALEKYKHSFVTFLGKFDEFKVVEKNNTIVVSKETVNHAPCPTDVDGTLPGGTAESISPRSKKRRHKAKAKKELFTLDTTPSLLTSNSAPKYSSKFKVLDGVVQEAGECAPAQPSAPTCFNCDGSHSLRDCQEPRDFVKIRMARQKFKPALKAGRYHLEEDQKFSHLKPGQLSEKLRVALGLGKWQIPHHVYKMRLLGYPPGWLEEARIVHSNISLFDMEGKNVKGKRSHKSSIDPDKVVSYPGFNIKPDSGCRDECNFYRVPPFSDGCSKEAMVNFINKMDRQMEDNLETCDMEIDANSDKEAQLDDVSQDGELTRISPSLTDLEIKKKQLLAELTNDEPTVNSETVPKKTTESETIEPPTIADTSLCREDNMNISIDDSTPNNKVKTSVFGTPILKSSSPFARLPNPDNFSKDVSPVINFENLPNSTGKYEQMTNVLDKVRKTLKVIQKT